MYTCILRRAGGSKNDRRAVCRSVDDLWRYLAKRLVVNSALAALVAVVALGTTAVAFADHGKGNPNPQSHKVCMHNSRPQKCQPGD